MSEMDAQLRWWPKALAPHEAAHVRARARAITRAPGLHGVGRRSERCDQGWWRPPWPAPMSLAQACKHMKRTLLAAKTLSSSTFKVVGRSQRRRARAQQAIKKYTTKMQTFW